MITIYLRAKAIVHRGKPEHYEQMVIDCARNVKLTKRGTKLLMYYAGCKNGFKPAGTTIEHDTGISAGNMRTIRKELINRGLIGYGDEFGNMLIVDWSRIRAFAALDKPLIFEKKHSEKYFAAVRENKRAAKEKRASKKRLLERGGQYKILGVDEKKDKFLQFFGNMNEQEYIELVTSFPEYDRSKQRKLMSDVEYAKYIDVKAFRPGAGDYLYFYEEAERCEGIISYLEIASQELPF